MLKRSSPCAGWLSSQTMPPDTNAIHLEVIEITHFVSVSFYRVDPDGKLKIESILGQPLPLDGRSIARVGDFKIIHSAPHQYIFWGADEQIAMQLRAIESSLAAVVDLSHARVAVRLSGTKAQEVLSLGVSVNLNPMDFKPGEFIQTSLDHNPVLIDRLSQNCFELVFLRTFAETQLQWLVDAIKAV